MPIHPELLEIVRCPKCKGKVAERDTKGGHGLVCDACKLVCKARICAATCSCGAVVICCSISWRVASVC